MSIEAMSWAWKQPVPSGEKLVLLAIADHADHTGKCWPGIDGLAVKTGLHRVSIIRAVKSLEKRAMLNVEHRPGDGKGRKSNLYHLPIGKVADCNVADCDIGGGQSRILSGQSSTVLPESSDKPSVSRAGKKKSSRAPADFWPTPEDFEAMRVKYPHLDLETETESMKDFEFKTPKSDWRAAWRNWIRRADTMKPRPKSDPDWATTKERV